MPVYAFGLLLIVFGTAIAGATWYSVDRIGMINRLCEAGFPNPTGPDQIDDPSLKCAVFDKRQTYFGTVRDAGSFVHFTSASLIPHGVSGTIEHDGHARFFCKGSECGAQLETMLQLNRLGKCRGDDIQRMRFAGAKVEGWVTLNEQQHGSKFEPNWARSIYVDKVLEVYEPPDSAKKEWTEFMDRALEGLC